ncbi:hypothetical protein TorRG33x02_025190 [Trema orientale]|uniref:Uncharacterized protein n=1 Tax=Trema orientale TaxID=63057 RepID=A0A2P5FVC5_TREOI|nr:hypothetical protein TorRG33x02_025190 [Trema orientale]
MVLIWGGLFNFKVQPTLTRPEHPLRPPPGKLHRRLNPIHGRASAFPSALLIERARGAAALVAWNRD